MSEIKVALVTGASRGAGAGIARALGAHGMTVYVTGRTVEPGDAKAWDGSVLPGTVAETAAAVTAAGGKGVAVLCDHSDDERVAAVFEQIRREQGRLDLLVNNATYMHPQLIEQNPFWQKDISACEILNVGLRSAYIASWHAAQMMVEQGRGLIAFGSSFGASCYMHGPAYGAQKAGLDKFAHDMAVDLRGSGVNTLSVWMGPLKTERAAVASKVNPAQYEAFSKTAESPEFTGHILYALATSNQAEALSGHTVIGAELARELGVTDEGSVRPSYRETLGEPPKPNPAVVY